MSADITTRLRDGAPFSDDGELLREAAAEIERLRAAVSTAWDEGHHAGVWNATDDGPGPFKDNPYATKADA